ncbi:hypothetical protein SODALDRAFT_332368 [Sodiomyces alkalinus F11]|uniref:Benzoylformate decarboxylase n=1 Tax=Sodiomyces alkalinus (strain CBS 110278 / VKM F-3762 / F11) TaxID=1314773 RepID=A0A3N2PWN0_SODAK|nr:hypothetical protein SODALDRAFT_332368 [Sodiomyces alkalinus F11]ROT38929.1 hypothetical protein SODALDRAFT_332368 [Sodiomyces alkalinus F11]
MLPITIRSPPSLDDFTPLEEYESRTPESFFDGKPVLHRHLTSVKAWIPKAHAQSLPIFTVNPSSLTPASAPAGASLQDDAAEEMVEQTVDIFVHSKNLTIFNPSAAVGVEIPYPAISIHAIKSAGTLASGSPLQAIWMQLALVDNGGSDEDETSIDLTVLPPVDADADADAVQALYDAISACSDLHPDPVDDEEDEDDDDDDDDRIIFDGDHEPMEGFTGVLRGNATGGLPPPFPGSSGWITAENLHEYFDSEGNWVGDGNDRDRDGQGEGVGGELGEGAGRVRGRDEANGADDDGQGVDSENKRPRVDDGAPS